MKTSTLARIYAFAISALFATVATVGIAVLMASSGEQARGEFEAGAAATQSIPADGPALTQWKVPAPAVKQVL